MVTIGRLLRAASLNRSAEIMWARSRVVACLLSTACALPIAAAAQEAKPSYRVGFLHGAFETPLFLVGPGGEAKLLEPLGYVEGKNLVVERRTAIGSNDRLPELAAELVALQVDVIVTSGVAATRAARNATQTIPIVMAIEGDPVTAGLVDTLARPGGNVTGITNGTAELDGKRLQLLMHLVPRLKRVGVFWNPANPDKTAEWRSLQTSAQSLGLELESLKIGTETELEPVFDAAISAGCNALLVTSGRGVTVQHASRIAKLSIAHRMPTMFPENFWVQSRRGLLSYGANGLDLSQQFAAYIDKILKGALPGDLPIERPQRFELFLNDGTAKEIGIQFPQSLLLQADRIID